MAKLFIFLTLICAFSNLATAQTTKRKTSPTTKPIKKTVENKPQTDVFDKGEVIGKFYFNQTFGFTLPLPENWIILEGKAEEKFTTQGFSANLINSQTISNEEKLQLEKSFKEIKIGLTAVKSLSKTVENAVLQISFESLVDISQVKDAIDYLDLMVLTFKNLKLPEDFSFSEVSAEKLGENEFGYLDIQTKTGKKRIYVITRKKYAILFTITYDSESDLELLRSILSETDFSI